MKLTKDNYYKTVDEYAERFIEGSDRSDVFEELVKKGIDKKEASLICDLAQSSAKRKIKLKENNTSLTVRGILIALIGGILSLTGYLILKSIESKGLIIISAPTILLDALQYSGLIIIISGIYLVIKDQLQKRKEKNNPASNILDN